MQDAYDRMQPAYDRSPLHTIVICSQHTIVCRLHAIVCRLHTYDRMQAEFYDRMQAACVPSVAPALDA